MTPLNDEQLAAVMHEGGPAIVLAGPGAGKTRVITHRVAHLLGDRGVDPESVLALTFTKKAAGEMKGRIRKLAGAGVHATTMHSWCFGYLAIASSYEEDTPVARWGQDRKGMVDGIYQEIMWRRACKSVSLNSEDAADLPETVSNLKNLGLSRADVIMRPDLAGLAEVEADAWREYERIKAHQRKLDYDDLLLETLKRLEKDPGPVRDRFRYVLVDEVQDLNAVQWKIIHQLCPPPPPEDRRPDLFVVGDVDQAVYEWRGAQPELALRFAEEYQASIYIVDRNYRSVPAILESAQRLIGHNRKRADKPLRPMRLGGVEPEFALEPSDRMEAITVADRIESWLGRDAESAAMLDAGIRIAPSRRPSDIAVLVRCWWQTCDLEEELAEREIPYRVLGGYGFFDRKEVRSLLSYLRLIRDLDDDDAVRDVLNVPNRFLGQKQRDALEERAEHDRSSLMDAIPHARWGSTWQQDRAMTFWRGVQQLHHRHLREPMRPDEALRRVLSMFGYEAWCLAQKDGEDRLDNARSMVASAAEYDSVSAYLDHIDRVRAFAENNERNDDAVSVLTIHRAKGLEWPCVALMGAAEGVLPHERSDNLEEERRLAFVAITRAEDALLVSAARQYGDSFHEPSRFVIEAGLYDPEAEAEEAAAPMRSGASAAATASLPLAAEQ